MTITAEERAILAHAVVDPDGWLTHAVATLGAKDAAAALEQKIARFTPLHTEQHAAAGADYKNRAERQAEEDAAHVATVTQMVADRAAAEQQKADAETARITALVDAAVKVALAAVKQ